MPFSTIQQSAEFMNIYARHDRFEEKIILFYDKTGKAFNPFYQISRAPGKSRP